MSSSLHFWDTERGDVSSYERQSPNKAMLHAAAIHTTNFQQLYDFILLLLLEFLLDPVMFMTQATTQPAGRKRLISQHTNCSFTPLTILTSTSLF